MESYKCPICRNADIHSIGYLDGKPYCRRCISFRGEEGEDRPSYTDIKKAGRTQIHQDDDRATITSSTIIKSKHKKKGKYKRKKDEIHEPAFCGSERINHRILIQPKI